MDMFYWSEITTAANTTKKSPNKSNIKVHGGVLTYIGIRFPSGCAGLVHCQLRIGEHSIFPRDFDTYVTGDDELVESRMFLKLRSGENTIRAIIWNEDDTFSHTLYIRMTVLPLAVAAPQYVFQGIGASMRTLLRRIGAI